MVVRKKAASTITLPLDIAYSILLILPVKSLKRFKTVCKSWNAIISDPGFAKYHLRQSKSSRNQNILMRYSCVLPDGELRLVICENSKLQVETIQERRNLYPGYLLCSSDDGLLLLSIPYSTSYLLWNPSSKQQKIITYSNGCNWAWRTFGFCRDQTLGDYKIVAITLNCYAVFSCKNKVWTEIKRIPYNSYILSSEGGVFVNGLCFFLTRNFPGWEIVYFDPIDETFNKLQKPREIKDFKHCHIFMTNLRGCLCLYNDADDGRQFQIWMMRDRDASSWTKYMNFNKHVIKLGNIGVVPLFLTERNELVMVSKYETESEIGIYKSTENRYEKLDTPTSMVPVMSSMTVSYVESLFFPIR